MVPLTLHLVSSDGQTDAWERQQAECEAQNFSLLLAFRILIQQLAFGGILGLNLDVPFNHHGEEHLLDLSSMKYLVYSYSGSTAANSGLGNQLHFYPTKEPFPLFHPHSDTIIRKIL